MRLPGFWGVKDPKGGHQLTAEPRHEDHHHLPEVTYRAGGRHRCLPALLLCNRSEGMGTMPRVHLILPFFPRILLSLTVRTFEKSWDWLYKPVSGLFCIFAKCVIILDSSSFAPSPAPCQAAATYSFSAPPQLRGKTALLFRTPADSFHFALTDNFVIRAEACIGM